MKTVNLILVVANVFFYPFVIFKTYQWYSPHVGFELPELTYLNIFAVFTILGMMTANGFVQVLIKLTDVEEAGLAKIRGVAITTMYGLMLLVSYLLQLILF